MNLNQLYVESLAKPNGGIRTVETRNGTFRIEAGRGELFDHVPVTVALVTHADKRGRPLAWSPTKDEDVRRIAIAALAQEERIQTLTFKAYQEPRA